MEEKGGQNQLGEAGQKQLGEGGGRRHGDTSDTQGVRVRIKTSGRAEAEGGDERGQEVERGKEVRVRWAGVRRGDQA